MPIDNVARSVSHVGNGAAVSFAFAFKVFAKADLSVTVDGVAQVLDADYTVTLGDPGGSVDFAAAPAAAAAVVIASAIPLKRTVDYTTAGPFRADAVDDELDRLTALVQDREPRIESMEAKTADLDSSVAAAAASEAAAAASEANAATSEAAAAASEANAATSEAAAAASEANAATSETNAAQYAALAAVTDIGTADARWIERDMTGDLSAADSRWRDLHGAMARASGAIGLASGGVEDISFTSEDYDTSGLHDSATNPERFTIPAGWSYVDIVFFVNVTSGANLTGTLGLTVYKNGSLAAVGATEVPAKGIGSTTMVACLTLLGVPCVPGDYFKGTIRNHLGQTVDLYGNSTYMIVKRAG